MYLQQRNETYQAAYYKECMKQKATNIIICPNSTSLPYVSTRGYDISALNKKLEKLRKTRRKRMRKQKAKAKIHRKTERKSKRKLKKNQNKK